MTKTNDDEVARSAGPDVDPSPQHAPTVPAHTPGPWSVHATFPEIVVPVDHVTRKIGGSSDPDREASEYAKQIHRLYHSYERDTDFYRSRVMRAEALANARLIAAAPELLEALKAAQCSCTIVERESGHVIGCWGMDADYVIAKAEGRA